MRPSYSCVAAILAYAKLSLAYNSTGFGTGPLDDYDSFVRANNIPNSTAEFDFLPWYGAGYDTPQWQLRVNVSQFRAPMITVNTNDPHIVSTSYDIRWPGNASTLNAEVALIPYLDPIRFCATIVHSYFPLDVTNAYNESNPGSCPGSFTCLNAIMKAYIEDGERDEGDGCIRNINPSSIDECKSYFPQWNATTYNLLGNGTRSPGVGIEADPTLPITEDKAFAYRSSFAFSGADNTTEYDAETKRLHMIILAADGSPSLWCTRLNNDANTTEGVGALAPSEQNAASLLRTSSMVAVVAMLAGLSLGL